MNIYYLGVVKVKQYALYEINGRLWLNELNSIKV